jgi:hypothetical protein
MRRGYILAIAVAVMLVWRWYDSTKPPTADDAIRHAETMRMLEIWDEERQERFTELAAQGKWEEIAEAIEEERAEAASQRAEGRQWSGYP